MINRFSAAPIFIFALAAAINSLGFIANIGGGAYAIIIAAAALLIYGLWKDRRLFIAGICTIALLGLFSFISGTIMDMSYDGMYFHKEAVYAIAKGWNPLYQPLSEFDRYASLQDLALWLDNYPKGVWSVYASLYNLCGQIECAKGVNILFVMMVFFSAYDAAKKVFSLKNLPALFISAAFAANPVILSQVFTFMNDLPVASILIVCGFYAMKIYANKADRLDYIILAAAFASSFTIKFTAPVYCSAVLLAYGLAVLIKNGKKAMFKPVICVICAGVIGLCFFGADPYIKHIANGQNPVYPVMGEGKYDIMNTNAPAGFDDMPAAKQLFVSLFSKSAANPGDAAVLKIPFTVSSDELYASGAPDVRVSGFGVLFSGILVLSIILAILTLFFRKNKNSAALPAIIAFIIMAFIVPESWWARYSPYIYYIPCLLLLRFAIIDKTSIISCLMSLLMLSNGAISFLCVYNTFSQKTDTIKGILTSIKDSGNTVMLNINDFPSHAIWFDEYGIDYTDCKTLPEGVEPIQFYQTTYYWFN